MFLNRIRLLSQQSAVRLTVGLMIVFAFVATASGGVTYFLVQRETNRMSDARLSAQAALLADALDQDRALPPAAFGMDFAVLTATGQSGRLPFALPNRPDGIYLLDQRGTDYRYIMRTLATGEKIVVSENVERQDELLDTLQSGLVVSMLGSLLAAIFAGGWFALRAQRRLDRISDGLSKVAGGHLDTRIALPGRPDDLSQLADRINNTTARLAVSMDQLRVQTSNIAHDLRTPLARLRASLETSLADLTTHGQAVDAPTLEAALDQIDHIVGTFNALLRLSRIESGAGKTAFKKVRLQALVEEVAEIFAPVVEDQGQKLELDTTRAAEIWGDHDMLVQLIANLIQNALRYGAADQTITLQVHGTVLSVVDQGAGIAIDEREKVLQPLYQTEKTRQSEGFGLGLSMVAAICTLHDAGLSLTDGHDGRGLAVTVRFPKLTNL